MYAALCVAVVILVSWALQVIQFSRAQSVGLDSSGPSDYFDLPRIWTDDGVSEASTVDSLDAASRQELIQALHGMDALPRYSSGSQGQELFEELDHDHFWRTNWPSRFEFWSPPESTHPGRWAEPSIRFVGWSVTDSCVRVTTDPSLLLADIVLVVNTSGWPFPAMKYTSVVVQHKVVGEGDPVHLVQGRDGMYRSPRLSYTGGIELRSTAALVNAELHRLALPLNPLWIGFGLNAIVYALLLACVMAAKNAITQEVRRRRQQCVGCGYLVGKSGQHSKCPECGLSRNL